MAVNSGTAALHKAALAAGVSDGDEVITSPITFVASANCAVYGRAKPVFWYRQICIHLGTQEKGRSYASSLYSSAFVAILAENFWYEVEVI